VKFRNKQIVGFWLMVVLMVGPWLGLSPNTADSFTIADQASAADVRELEA